MKKIEPDIPTVLLSGTISNLRRARRSHNFVLTQSQHWQVGATALGATAMGMGAAGIGLLNMATNSEEEADWVQFELDGKQIDGWLWMMPMRDGDKVEVVAQQVRQDQYIAYAVKREGDELLAVYPHTTAGRKAHYRNMRRMMWRSFFVVYPMFLVMTYFASKRIGGISLADFAYLNSCIGICGFLMFSILFYRAARRLVRFAYLAETIFGAYGWPDVENIDLRKTSRENRRENRLPNYGNFYFRYK
ncbi:putative type VI secretion system effector [Trinickia sp. EG282A]|uniref:putative type VI secretion system effector n=1 Tax=Trinickia sp. EG282A TaxID=3237013 RepID=UPI0034D16CF1